MNLRSGLIVRATLPYVLLSIALAEAGCVRLPRHAADSVSQQRKNESPVLRPKEGLSFRAASMTCGANIDPIHSGTGYESSDGESISFELYSFKRQESAVKFYDEELSRARSVLNRGEQQGESKSGEQRRAVIGLETKNSRASFAVIEQDGTHVDEIIGPTVGHVLAFENGKEHRNRRDAA